MAEVFDSSFRNPQPWQVLLGELSAIAKYRGHQLRQYKRFTVLFLPADGLNAADGTEGHPIIFKHVERLGIVLTRV